MQKSKRFKNSKVYQFLGFIRIIAIQFSQWVQILLQVFVYKSLQFLQFFIKNNRWNLLQSLAIRKSICVIGLQRDALSQQFLASIWGILTVWCLIWLQLYKWRLIMAIILDALALGPKTVTPRWLQRPFSTNFRLQCVFCNAKSWYANGAYRACWIWIVKLVFKIIKSNT